MTCQAWWEGWPVSRNPRNPPGPTTFDANLLLQSRILVHRPGPQGRNSGDNVTWDFFFFFSFFFCIHSGTQLLLCNLTTYLIIYCGFELYLLGWRICSKICKVTANRQLQLPFHLVWFLLVTLPCLSIYWVCAWCVYLHTWSGHVWLKRMCALVKSIHPPLLDKSVISDITWST